jgi:hypothetical protein
MDHQKKKGSEYGYLMLPEGLRLFKPIDLKDWNKEKQRTAAIDVLLYEVSIDDHPDKDVELDIATKGEYWYRFPFIIHRNIGPDNEVVVCPRTFGDPCPIDEYISDGLKNKTLDYDKDVKPIKQSYRDLFAVRIKDENDYDEDTPVIWDVSWYTFLKKLNAEIAEEEEYSEFPAQEGGYTLKVRFEKKPIGKDVEFADVAKINCKKRDYDIPDELIEKVPPLESLVIVKSYNELYELFHQIPREMIEGKEKEKPPIDPPKETSDEDKPKMKRKGKKAEPEPEEKKESEKEDTPCENGFGEKTDTLPECEDCEMWDECYEKKMENEDDDIPF